MSITLHTQTGPSPEAETFYQSVGYTYGIEPAATVVLAKAGEDIVGIVRVVPEHGTSTLRGMQISPQWQRKGIGQLMLDELAGHIRGACYCLPHNWLQTFYGHIGFHTIPTAEAPEYLQQRLARNLTEFPHLITMKRNA